MRQLPDRAAMTTLPEAGASQPGHRSGWLQAVWPRSLVTLGILVLALALGWTARSPGWHERGRGPAPAAQSQASAPGAPEPKARHASLEEFDEAGTLALLDEIRAVAGVCTAGLGAGPVTVRVTFHPSGEAANVDVQERARIDDATGDCLNKVFGLARVHPFWGPPRTVVRTWQMP